MKKWLLSILLVLCLCLSLLPTAALATGTPSYSIENGTLVISGTTDGSNLPPEGFTSIEITSTGVVTGGTYTSYYVENRGTIKDGNFGEVMNHNGGTGSGLALIEGGTFEKVSNFGNMTGGTVKTLTNMDTTNYKHTVRGVTVTGSISNNNSVCYSMDLRIDLDNVHDGFASITYVAMTVDGTTVQCAVGRNAKEWLNTYVANATWYKMVNGVKTPLTDTEVIPCQPVEYVSNLVTMIVNGVERRCPAGEPANAWLNNNVETPTFGWYYLSGKDWIELTDTDVFPDTRTVYSKIPGMSLGTSNTMTDINGNSIARVGDTIGVFNASAEWYVDGQQVKSTYSPPSKSYSLTNRNHKGCA